MIDFCRDLTQMHHLEVIRPHMKNIITVVLQSDTCFERNAKKYLLKNVNE